MSRTYKALQKMESPVNPHIEAFYKAFSIFTHMTVYIDHVEYPKLTYRPSETLQEAKELIKKLDLPLTAVYNPIFTTLSINLI